MTYQPLRVLRRSEELLRLRELRQVAVAVARPLGLFQFPFLELFDSLFPNFVQVFPIEIVELVNFGVQHVLLHLGDHAHGLQGLVAHLLVLVAETQVHGALLLRGGGVMAV